MSSSLTLPPAFSSLSARAGRGSYSTGGGGTSNTTSLSTSPNVSAASALFAPHHSQHQSQSQFLQGPHMGRSVSVSGCGSQMPPRSPRLVPPSPPRMTRPVSEPNAAANLSPPPPHAHGSAGGGGASSCSCSPALRARTSPSLRRAPTVETHSVHARYNAQGQKQINQYVIDSSAGLHGSSEIGRGSFGRVLRVYSTVDGKYYAMKVMNKSLLKKRRIMGFSAGSSMAASRSASLGGQGGVSVAQMRGAVAAAGLSSGGSLISTGGGGGASPSPSPSSASPPMLVREASMSAASEHWANVQREIAILKKCRHPHIVRLVEVMDDPAADCLYLVMEYMERGALMPSPATATASFSSLASPSSSAASPGAASSDQHAMSVFRPLPTETLRRYLRDILLGLEYLHANKIVHRDLKPENLLLSSGGRVAISDFGVSMLFEGEDDRVSARSSTVGSAAFLPPELCGGGLGLGLAAGNERTTGVVSASSAASSTASASTSATAAVSTLVSSPAHPSPSSSPPVPGSSPTLAPAPAPSPTGPSPALLAVLEKSSSTSSSSKKLKEASPGGDNGGDGSGASGGSDGNNATFTSRSFSMPVGIHPAPVIVMPTAGPRPAPPSSSSSSSASSSTVQGSASHASGAASGAAAAAAAPPGPLLRALSDCSGSLPPAVGHHGHGHHGGHGHGRSASSMVGLDISGKKGDIWSLGVSVYVLLFGCLPFVGRNVHALYRSIVEDELLVPPPMPPSGSPGCSCNGGGCACKGGVGGGGPVSLQHHLSSRTSTNPNGITLATHPDLVDLLRRMLDKNPHTRISLQEIKRHPWITLGGREPMEEQHVYDDEEEDDDEEDGEREDGEEGAEEEHHHHAEGEAGQTVLPSSASFSAPGAAASIAAHPSSSPSSSPLSASARSRSLAEARQARRLARAHEKESRSHAPHRSISATSPSPSALAAPVHPHHAHGRSTSSASASSTLGEPLAEEREEEVLSDTDTEVEAEVELEVEGDAEGEAAVKVEEVPTRQRQPSRQHRSSLSSAAPAYPRLSVTSADVLGAVTLVHKVCMVVKLKSKMRKLKGQARERSNSNAGASGSGGGGGGGGGGDGDGMAAAAAAGMAAQYARARSSSMSEVDDVHHREAAATAASTARKLAIATSGSRGGALSDADITSPPPFQKALSSPTPSLAHAPAPTTCLSPSLSQSTHISVPLEAHHPHAHGHHAAKRRGGAMGAALLAEARAAISAGQKGEDAAQAWVQRHGNAAAEGSSGAGDEEDVVDAPTLAVRLNLVSPKGSPLSPPQRPAHGRIVQFPHRRCTPRSGGGGGPVPAFPRASPPISEQGFTGSTESGAFAVGRDSGDSLSSASGSGSGSGQGSALFGSHLHVDARSSGDLMQLSPAGSASSAPISAASASVSVGGSSSSTSSMSMSNLASGGSGGGGGSADYSDALMSTTSASSSSSAHGFDAGAVVGLASASGTGTEVRASRHQSAPLRSPRALFVPMEKYKHEECLSCSHADEQIREHHHRHLQQHQLQQHAKFDAQRSALVDAARAVVVSPDRRPSFGPGDAEAIAAAAAAASAAGASLPAASPAGPPYFLRPDSRGLMAPYAEVDVDVDVDVESDSADDGLEEGEEVVEAIEPLRDLDDI